MSQEAIWLVLSLLITVPSSAVCLLLIYLGSKLEDCKDIAVVLGSLGFLSSIICTIVNVFRNGGLLDMVSLFISKLW